jgi:hypothetical protein
MVIIIWLMTGSTQLTKNVVDASNIIAKITHLEATLSILLHLGRVPLSETCYQINTSREMINRIRVSQVMYTRCSGNCADECKGHLYRHPSEPSTEQVTASLVEVRVELPYYSFHRRAVILYHVYPPLGHLTLYVPSMRARQTPL